MASNGGNGTTAIETVHLNGLICRTIQRWIVTSYIYLSSFLDELHFEESFLITVLLLLLELI